MDPRQELVREVFTHFYKTGEWPQSTKLQIKLRRLGNLGKLAHEVGHELITCDRSGSDSVCRLTLRGLASCQGAEKEVERFLWTVRALATDFLTSGATQSIQMSELTAPLKLSSLELRRLGELSTSRRVFGVVLGPMREETSG